MKHLEKKLTALVGDILAKKSLLLILLFVMVCACIGCGHEHTWIEASCEEPKHCSECGEIEGEALGHSFIEATCEEPKTCSLCGITEGEALGHDIASATYESPEICNICGKTFGEPIPSAVEKEGIVFEELGKFDLVKVQFTMDEETRIITKCGTFVSPCEISVTETPLEENRKRIDISLYEGLADWSYDYRSMTQCISIFDIYTGKTMDFSAAEDFILPTKDSDIEVNIEAGYEDVENSVDKIYWYSIVVPEDYDDLAFRISQADFVEGMEHPSNNSTSPISDIEATKEGLDYHCFMLSK